MAIASANAAYRSVAANVPPDPVVFIKPDWIPPEPDWADFGDASYALYWKDQDVDDNATITLFYDNDQNSGNGNLGVIATAIPNGDYYVGATISDEATAITSYSIGKVRVYHFPKISAAYDPAGLASVWSDPVVDDPHLVHSHVVLRWEELEPCGDDNYFWEINPVSGRYYQDVDLDGTQQKTPSSAVFLWGLL